MSRALKRVPVDFDWPIGVMWGGYRNPHYACRGDCKACGGTGYAPAARLYKNQWYGQAAFDPVVYGADPLRVDDPGVVAFAERNVKNSPEYFIGRNETRERAVKRESRRLWELWRGMWEYHLIQADIDALIAEGRLWDLTHRWTPEDGWTPVDPRPTVTPLIVRAWSMQGIGHDSTNCYVCVKARCEREGEEVTCQRCGGEGDEWPSKAHKALAEAWEPIEPPTGDGYQVWETVSEGSPLTPVFATPGELADWCVANLDKRDGGTRDQWMRFIDAGWCPSAVVVDGVFTSGVGVFATEA